MQHVFASLHLGKMLKIIKTRNITAVKVNRIKSLDIIVFAVFAIYEYK